MGYEVRLRFRPLSAGTKSATLLIDDSNCGYPYPSGGAHYSTRRYDLVGEGLDGPGAVVPEAPWPALLGISSPRRGRDLARDSTPITIGVASPQQLARVNS
jgi:hypothetical protein